MRKELIIATLALSVITYACGGGQEEKADEKEELLPGVEVAKAKTVDEFSHWVTFQGTVEAKKSVILNSESGGVVRAVYVDEGQKVRARTPLMVMGSEIIAQNIMEVESALDLAEYVLEKQERLYEQRIGSELELKQAQNNVEALERQLSTLRVQAGKAVIYAPFDGYVEEIYTQIGEAAAPQIPAVRFMNLDKITVNSEISESYLNKVKEGSEVQIYFSALDSLCDSLTVDVAGKFINPANRTFNIQMNLDNPDHTIVPNLMTEVRVKDESISNALVIPSRSIMEDKDGNKYVFVVTPENYAIRRSIKPILSYKDRTAIERNNGINEGEDIVITGAEGLRDSSQVLVKEF